MIFHPHLISRLPETSPLTATVKIVLQLPHVTQAHEDLLAAFLSTKALDITPRPLPRPRHAITESVLTDILYGCDLPLPVLLALKTAERLLLKERGVTRKQLAEWALLQTQMYRDEHACAERYISERDTALKEAHTLREKAAKVAVENVIKLLLHNISKQEWQVAIENESVKSGYVASVINPALQDTQLYARRTEYVYGAENVHGWFCCNGIASRLETRGDTRIDAAQRMIAAILSGVFKFTNDK